RQQQLGRKDGYDTRNRSQEHGLTDELKNEFTATRANAFPDANFPRSSLASRCSQVHEVNACYGDDEDRYDCEELNIIAHATLFHTIFEIGLKPPAQEGVKVELVLHFLVLTVFAKHPPDAVLNRRLVFRTVEFHEYLEGVVAPVGFISSYPFIGTMPMFVRQKKIELEGRVGRNVVEYASNFEVELVVDTYYLVHRILIAEERFRSRFCDYDVTGVVEHLFSTSGDKGKLEHLEEFFADIESPFTQACFLGRG